MLSFPTHFSQFLPPFFNSFLPPFSLFLLYFSQFLLCFSHCWTILSVSYYFSQFLHPFPLYSSFSSFPNLTCSLFTSSCPHLLVACSFFPVHISQLFSLSLFICPIWSTVIYFPVSSLICQAHVLSFMQFMPPFLCSYLICPLPIRITPFSQFLFPNSLVLPSSSSVCSVSSFFVLNVTMLFCLLG